MFRCETPRLYHLKLNKLNAWLKENIINMWHLFLCRVLWNYTSFYIQNTEIFKSYSCVYYTCYISQSNSLFFLPHQLTLPVEFLKSLEFSIFQFKVTYTYPRLYQKSMIYSKTSSIFPFAGPFSFVFLKILQMTQWHNPTDKYYEVAYIKYSDINIKENKN